MKRILSFLGIIFCLVQSVDAQLVNGVNFQGVARNASGMIISNRKITVRLTVREGSATGVFEYSEVKSVVTNAVGLFVVVLGDPTPPSTIVTGSYTNINWSTGNKYLEVEIDPNGGIDFVSMGSQKVNFVPFAHYAYGVDAKNVAGVLGLAQGGTGVNNLIDLKSILQVDKIDNTRDADKPVSTATKNALDKKLDAVLLGAPNGVAGLDVTGKVPSAQLPPASIASVEIVNSEAAMLSLATVPIGSVAIRTDISRSFILSRIPGSVLANWKELLSPAAAVQSVNGRTGIIFLTKSDLGLDNVDNTSDLNKPVSNAVSTVLSTKENNANKSINITTDAASDTKYPSVKAVKTYTDSIAGTIPAAQVNSDWNATTGVAQILNKPVLTAVATSGSYNDLLNKPALFDGNYTSLTNRPALFSGNYNDLTNKPAAYTLPVASASTLGGVKTGSNINIDANGVISATGTGLGSVTSVALALPDMFTVTGSPITTMGTFSVTLAGQNANLVFAGPASGSAAAPTFRALAASDIPVLNQNTTGTAANVTGTVAIGNGGTGATTAAEAITALLPAQTGNAGKFLQTDGTTLSWVATSGGLAVPVTGENGGTGVANTGKTITLGGNLVTIGAYTTTLTATATTNLTLPVTGTLATLGGTETLTNKTLTTPAISSPTITGTLSLPSGATGVTATAGDNTTKLATTAFVSTAVTNATPNATASVKGLLQLAGDLSGTASVPTVATVGGATAANIASATALANAATSANTANAIVKRDASGNFSAGNITAAVFIGTLSGTAGTATTAETVTAAAQPNITSLGSLTGLTVAGDVNVTGTLTAGTLSATTVNGTLGTAAQPNITSVGTLGSLNVSGTVTAGTLSATTINGTLGTAAQTNITAVGTLGSLNVSGTATVGTLSATTINGSLSAAAQNNITSLGNLTGLTVTGDANITGTVTAGTLSATTINGTLGTAAQTNITSVGTLGSLNVSGTATAGTLSATTINGTLGTASQTNITSVGTLGSLNVSGTATVGTLSATTINGSLSTAAQNNITSLANLTGLTVTGNANITGTATAGTLSATTINGVLGTGSQTNITSVGTLGSLNVTGTATAGTLSATTINGTLSTPAQTSITSLGNLTGLTVSGDANITGTATIGTLSATTINGSLSAAAQNNITSLANLTGLTVTGNANITGTATAGTLSATTINGTLSTVAQPSITSLGSLSGLTVSGNANITGTVTAGTLSATTIVGTLSTPAQASITSVGTLTGLTVSGTTTLSSFNTAGYVKNNISGVLSTGALDSTDINTGLGYNPVRGYYGSFYSTVSQTAAVANTIYTMTLNTTEIGGHGVSVQNSSQIKVDYPGVYNLQFSAQVDNTANNTAIVTIWFRINGVDVPNSATDFNLINNTALEVAAWNDFFALNGGDYVEIMWSSTFNTVSLTALAARASPTRPAVPSLIVTMHRVN